MSESESSQLLSVGYGTAVFHDGSFPLASRQVDSVSKIAVRVWFLLAFIDGLHGYQRFDWSSLAVLWQSVVLLTAAFWGLCMSD